MLALCVVLVPVAALALSLSSHSQWTATAQLLFRDPGFDQKLFGSSYLSPSQDPAREAATNVRLVELDTVFARAARLLGQGITADDLTRKVSVVGQGQSDVVAVNATDSNQQFAARIANVVAEQYIEFRRDADRRTILQALRLIDDQISALPESQRNGSRSRSLRDRAEQLQILASLQTGNAELVQRAQPPKNPSSPKTVRNVLVALVLGLMLGLALAVLADRLDKRLRDQSEIEDLLGIPILAEIPERQELSRPSTALERHGPAVEAFQTLRTNLRFLAMGHRSQSLVVTSAAPGEGKSTIALNLAMAAAASGARAVLVEADLRRPTLARLVNGSPHGGLVAALIDDAAISDVVQTVAADRYGSQRSLDVIVAGATPPNPTELLESDRLGEVLDELSAAYEFIVIDSPPIGVVADTVPLVQRSSGLLLVVRQGVSTRVGVRELRRRLDNLQLKPLGTVVNSSDALAPNSYYAYYTQPAGDTESAVEAPMAGDRR